MDPISLLTEQHRQMNRLFQRIENSEGEASKDLFAYLADLFLAHCHIEEELFYPRVYADRTEDELREAVEEHLQAKRIVADLLELDRSDEQWSAKCSVLKADIQHHVHEEETELFPIVQSGYPKEPLSKLGRLMNERWLELSSEGEPRLLVFEEIDQAVAPA